MEKEKKGKIKERKQKNKIKMESKNVKKRIHREAFKSDVEVEEYSILTKNKKMTNDSKENNFIKK